MSQVHAAVRLSTGVNPDCPELRAGELEAEELAGGEVSTSWGAGSDVEDQALAARHAASEESLAGIDPGLPGCRRQATCEPPSCGGNLRAPAFAEGCHLQHFP